MIKYNILIERNQLEIKHLKQVQILENSHICEIYNMMLKQVLIFNQSYRNQLIEYHQNEQKQLKKYHKFEALLMFKNNNLINQLKRYNKSEWQIKNIYKNIKKITFQKDMVNNNIVSFFKKKIL